MSACIFASAVAFGSAPAPAASSSTVVGATVPSATMVDAAGCAPFVPGRTDFGVVQPGSPAVTTQDCDIVFGSSNDTATLRAYQLDGTGMAMTAAPDRLDTSFGTGGIADLGTCGANQFVDVEVHTDGTIYGVGSCSGSGTDTIVARFLADGTLDTGGFNAPTGYLKLNLGVSNDSGAGIAIEPDGDAIVVGTASNGTDNDISVARIKADGTLDTAGFNSPNGFRRIDLGFGGDSGTAVAIQPDGKLLVAGNAKGGGLGTDVYLARLNPDGSFDTAGFNAPNGYVTADNGNDDQITDLMLDSSGRAVLVGRSQAPALYAGMVWRFLADGSLDTGGFNAPNGVRVVDLPSYHDRIRSVTELPDGDLMVGGDIGVPGNSFVARLTPAGALDTSFGSPNGYLVLTPGTGVISQSITEVLAQPDGTTYAVMLRATPGFSVLRFDEVGLDTAFGGGDGIVDSGLSDETMSAAMQGHQLVIAGDLTSNRPSMVRFGGPEVTDYENLGGAGDHDWSSGAATDLFGVCLRDVTGATTGVWVVDADNDCTAADTDPWRSIPATSTTASRVASSTASGTVDAHALLRFGFRPATTQAPGLYQAGITFEVVAPAA